MRRPTFMVLALVWILVACTQVPHLPQIPSPTLPPTWGPQGIINPMTIQAYIDEVHLEQTTRIELTDPVTHEQVVITSMPTIQAIVKLVSLSPENCTGAQVSIGNEFMFIMYVPGDVDEQVISVDYHPVENEILMDSIATPNYPYHIQGTYSMCPDFGKSLYELLGIDVSSTLPPEPPLPSQTNLQARIPSPAPWLGLPTTNETILTIRNDQPYSGRVGEPKPDWIGWGAQAFSMAPNGDIWILDNAAQPQRLVYLAPPYVTPQLIPLEGLVVGEADVEAASDAIWVLGIASQPPCVVKLSTDGKLLGLYDLPNGLWPENGLSGIALAPDGSLLAELEGGAKLYQVFDQNGQIAPQLLEGYTFDGRLFRVSTTTLSKTATIYAGNIAIEVSSPLPIGGLRVIGAAPDGSFYAEMYMMPEVRGSTGVREILRYSPEGLLRGVAYPHPAEFYAQQDVVVGPNGLVYQLVSNQDHSVLIVRMGFKTGESALAIPTASPTLATTPLTPLLPTWTVTPVGASDLDLARHTLLAFFTLLHDGRYTDALSIYGGDYDTMREQNPDIPADDYAALWQAACTLQTPCLLVSRIVEEKSIAQDEFEFAVEFVRSDGTLFKLGPCCGATEAEMPPVWQFPYMVKKVGDLFKVMEGPVYVP